MLPVDALRFCLRRMDQFVPLLLCLMVCCAESTTGYFHSRHIPSWPSRGHRPSNSLKPEHIEAGYTTMYYEQPVDHFAFSNADRFQQRYLVVDKWWDREGNGPVLFYTGNEGDIVWFMNNTGLMFDWAPELKALLVFAEHRYYGETMPYGNDSYKDPAHAGYLTSEQALADFARLIAHIKANVTGAARSPFVAVGGSYGGMLAAWMRIKYPHAVVGALSASAPIWNFGDLTPCGGFSEVVTRDFDRAGPNCAKNIRRSWDVITRIGQTPQGLSELSKIFRLCNTLTSSDALSGWLNTAWVYMAMVDYPYPADFLVPLPGWPIQVTCSHLSGANLSDTELMQGLADAANVYYNYSGVAKCFNLSQDVTPSLGDQGWGFQSCTEMVMPQCSDGVHDMFPPSPWVLPAVMAQCLMSLGVTPRPQWVIEQYGGKDIKAASNIIFSNGVLDPWSAGGVLQTLSETLVAIVIEGGAHHLDLRTSNPLDPPSVVAARKLEKQIVQGWISAHREKELRMLRGGGAILSNPIPGRIPASCDERGGGNCSARTRGLFFYFYEDDGSTAVGTPVVMGAILTLLFLVLLILGGMRSRDALSVKSFDYESVDKLSLN